MSNDWFRSWHGAPTDPKWLLIAAKAGVKPCHVAYTWWALMDHGSQHADRGCVADFDEETFGHFAGLDVTHVSRIVTTLTEKGLIADGHIAQWGKRQPKREDETAAERKRRSRANNGGKPPSGGHKGARANPDEQASHAASHNVTTDKDEIREDSSVAIATATVVPHPAADFCKAVFDSGVSLLVASGKNDSSARSLIGRWRKAVGDGELLTLIRNSEIEGHSDPVGWLTAAVEARSGKRPSKSTEYRDPILGDAFDALNARLDQAHGA